MPSGKCLQRSLLTLAGWLFFDIIDILINTLVEYFCRFAARVT